MKKGSAKRYPLSDLVNTSRLISWSSERATDAEGPRSYSRRNAVVNGAAPPLQLRELQWEMGFEAYDYSCTLAGLISMSASSSSASSSSATSKRSGKKMQGQSALEEPAILRKIREGARQSGASKLRLKEINAEIRAVREERRRRRAS